MRRWRIACIGATEIRLHASTLLYALYAAMIGQGRFMLIAMLSILLHESAHAFSAAAAGHPPSSLELTPLGAVAHLDEQSGMPPVQRAMVLIAGPAMTFLLMCASFNLTRLHLLSPAIGRMLLMCNMSILLINLLPVLPLDGGQLLALLLSRFMTAGNVHRVMRTLGWLAGVGLIAVNVLASVRLGGWNLSLAFAGCCILYSAYTATTTQAMAELRDFMDRKIRLERKGSLPIKTMCALGNLPLRRVVRSLPQGRMAEFVCVEVGSMRVLGRIGEQQLIQAYLAKPDATLAHALRMQKNPAEATK